MSANGTPLDDVDRFLAEQLEDPDFAAAYEDVAECTQLILDLIAARKQAGLAPADVAASIARWVEIRPRRARRWVDELEKGRLMDAPQWLLRKYARAVGCRIRMSIEDRKGDPCP